MPSHSRFTIAIAGYQNEPYLPKSLGSVKSQTFADFEAICYVEESTDRSLEMCRHAAADDARFKVVAAPKSGAVSATRNYAIDNAAGEYIVVLDGDDWLAPNMLEAIDARLRETGPVDIVSFAAVLVASEGDSFEKSRRFSNFGVADASGVFTGIEALRRSGKYPQTWLCAYRTDFLREHRLYQSEGLIMEDFGWRPRAWFAAERFAYIDAPLYAYRRRAGSIMTEASPRIAVHLVKHFRILADFAFSHDIPADIMRKWSNEWISMLYWFLFHPVTSRKIDRPARAKALNTLFEKGGFRRLLALARFASLPKRLSLPLLLVAWAGWHAPAILFFRKIYYTLAERADGRSKGLA